MSIRKISNSITKILKAKLVDLRVDRAQYHGGDLESTSTVGLFQNIAKIFKELSNEINKINTNNKQIVEVNEYTNRAIEICTVFMLYSHYQEHYVVRWQKK